MGRCGRWSTMRQMLSSIDCMQWNGRVSCEERRPTSYIIDRAQTYDASRCCAVRARARTRTRTMNAQKLRGKIRSGGWRDTEQEYTVRDERHTRQGGEQSACVCYRTMRILHNMTVANNRKPDAGGRRAGRDRPVRIDPKPRRECANQLILSSSTSNWRVELGGITGGKPRAPYA